MGDLQHPDMEGDAEYQNDNIMYRFAPPDRVETALRYREIQVIALPPASQSYQSQWSRLHP
jgi:hypothetical protein